MIHLVNKSLLDNWASMAMPCSFVESYVIAVVLIPSRNECPEGYADPQPGERHPFSVLRRHLHALWTKISVMFRRKAWRSQWTAPRETMTSLRALNGILFMARDSSLTFADVLIHWTVLIMFLYDGLSSLSSSHLVAIPVSYIHLIPKKTVWDAMIIPFGLRSHIP